MFNRYREALRLDPDHVEAHFNLACITSGKERLKHLRRVLKGSPRHKQVAFSAFVLSLYSPVRFFYLQRS